MIDLTESQKADYFRRSFTAVDGLWFMLVEERFGFEAALERDEAVWKVLPKIQARSIKAMMNLGAGLHDLAKAIRARLAMEGFEYEMKVHENGFDVIISKCPWHDLMVKSGREELSERVSEIICRTENSVWASEFHEEGAGEIEFQRAERICKGRERCIWHFSYINKKIINKV
ncbi:L-2-amino-thiazoline-4-carboxylic acid hydrolase [uncultured archaeon]|nr:L-2-amino-thiazoline-4-carboxylic acid hydrolase [uncultured archaeon]